MSTSRRILRHDAVRLATVVALALAFLNTGPNTPLADAAGQPANKITAVGAAIDVMGPTEVTVTSDGEEVSESAEEVVSLLSETIKTSKTTDLLFQVSLECGITTTTLTRGDSSSQASGHVEVWVEVDGVEVPVGYTDPAATTLDNGHAVFCNRTYGREQSGFAEDDEDGEEQEAIKTFIDTRQANAFNWMTIDVGSGTHTIEVKAILRQTATASGGLLGGESQGSADASALAVIGKRTLIIEPVRAANGESVYELG